ADIPVLLGGAALTRTYVERDMREVYEGRVFYGRDAFEGLRTMDALMEGKRTGQLDPSFGREISERAIPRRSERGDDDRPSLNDTTRSDVPSDNVVPAVPFLGPRHAKGISLDEIAEYVNETALFRNQWQYRPEGGESDEQFKQRIRPIFRERLAAA